jgi:FkbM family methyltransferase
MIVKTWDGFLFMVRARTPDLYTVAVAERYELEKWFKPLAKGVIVDVGTYIGTYTVRALKTADLVIAVEPLPLNFKVLKVNVGLNDHARRSDVILVEKAVAGAKGKARIFIPLGETIGTSVATLRYIEGAPSLTIEADTLDNILQELGVSKVDMLKIDVEGYVFKSLPGMVESLRRTRWLFIELMGSDLQSVTVLRRLGFKLQSRHGPNFLFKNENIL